MNERQNTNLSDASHSQSSSAESNLNADSMVVQQHGAPYHLIATSPRSTVGHDHALPPDADGTTEDGSSNPVGQHNNRSHEEVAGMLTANDSEAASPPVSRDPDTTNTQHGVAPRGQKRLANELDGFSATPGTSPFHRKKHAGYKEDLRRYGGCFPTQGESSTATVTDNDRTDENADEGGNDNASTEEHAGNYINGEGEGDGDGNDDDGDEEQEEEQQASQTSRGSSEGHNQGRP